MSILACLASAGMAALSGGACFRATSDDDDTDDEPMVSGAATDQGQGVEGLQVCAAIPGAVRLDNARCTHSGPDGLYELWGDNGFYGRAEAGFTLALRDVDGPAGGEYLHMLQEFPDGSLPVEWDFDLVPAEPEVRAAGW